MPDGGLGEPARPTAPVLAASATPQGFARAHAGLLAVAGGFSLVLNLALLAPSLYMLQVFDRVLTTRSVETLVLLTLLTLGALLLMFVLDLLRGRLLVLLGALFERDIGTRALERALASDADPALAANALRDTASLRGFVAGPGIVALFDAPWMLVYLGVTFLFSALLGVLAVASAVALGLLAWINQRLTHAGLEAAQRQARETGRFIDAILRQADAVRALGMGPAVVGRWRARQADGQIAQLRVQRISGAIASLGKGLRQSVQVLMMAAAAWLVTEQRATAGVMIAVTVILGRALAPAESLIAHWKSLVEARAAWGRLAALLARPAPARFGALPDPVGRVSVEGLSYATGDGSQRLLLRNVSFTVAPGGVLGVIGPSGSGKSTLAKLLVGALRPSAGCVRIDGAELGQHDPARLGQRLGYLPQEVALFDGSVAENIARLGGDGDSIGGGVGGDIGNAGGSTGDAVVAAAGAARALEMILRLPAGFDTPVGEDGLRLSGGQRQRVGLARALYGDPALVVLDEPDAHLDAEGEAALAETLRQLRARGKAVVVVTQRGQILSAVDRVLVLRAGSVERIGRIAGVGAETIAVAGAP